LVESCWSQDPKCRPDVITVATNLQSSCPLHSVDMVPIPVDGMGDISRDSDHRPSQNAMFSPFKNRAWQTLAQHEEVDVDGLTQFALDSITILKRWYASERSGHPVVVKVMDEIVQQSEDYFGAISASMAKAKSGRLSATRAAELGKSVISIPTQGLQKSLASMLRIATETSAHSENTEGTFGRVCAGFVQILDNVHSDLSKIITGSQQDRDIARRDSVNQIFPNEVERKAEGVSLRTVQADLKQAQDDLQHLLLSTSHFRNWWAKITTKLGTIESMTPDIVHDASKSLLGIKVAQRWEEVQAQYSLYAEKVVVIENMHLKLIQGLTIVSVPLRSSQISKSIRFSLQPHPRKKQHFKKGDSQESCVIC